jgi:acylphosphatase
MPRQRVVFLGRVQGVGFRATTRAIATGLGLSGWVRNEPDASVLMEAQGSQEALAELQARIDRAFPRSVTDRRVETLGEIPGDQGFEIRR